MISIKAKKVIKDLIIKLIYKLFGYQFLEIPDKFYFIKKNKIHSLKNKFKGESCIIIGNGPSLNKIDMDYLKDKNTFGVNSIFYKDRFVPKFYTVEDTHVLKDNLKKIRSLDYEYQFFPSIYKKYLGKKDSYYYFNMNRGFYEPLSPNYENSRFSYDISRTIYCGQSVTIINLQIAHYLGFDTVALIGMDFDYVIPESATVVGKDIISNDDDPNHFHPEYFGKGKSWHDPKLYNVLKSYKLVKTVYENSNKKIINCTIGGRLEVFDRDVLSNIV